MNQILRRDTEKCTEIDNLPPFLPYQVVLSELIGEDNEKVYLVVVGSTSYTVSQVSTHAVRRYTTPVRVPTGAPLFLDGLYLGTGGGGLIRLDEEGPKLLRIF